MLAAIVALLWALPVVDTQATWPERTITLIVPFPPGGPNDLLGRMLAAELAAKLGRSVIVENRAGATGNIGLTAAARAAPDGYTFVIVTGVALINPSVAKVSYDPLRDFAPIAYLGASPNAIVTRPASGINDLVNLIAKAKANPGKLTFGSPGTGSISQLAVELLKLRANIDLTHVPFSGSAPALQAAIAGTTDITCVNIAGLIGYLRSGTLQAIVQTGSTRWRDMPGVPTMDEEGIPNAVVETEQMFFAPAGTPPEIINRLAEETRVILQKPEVKATMFNAGFLVKFEGPEDLHVRIVHEVPMWKEIVERAGMARKATE
jgi:tripartite-type tricarboxylate transporter receptor subunit TctC